MARGIWGLKTHGVCVGGGVQERKVGKTSPLVGHQEHLFSRVTHRNSGLPTQRLLQSGETERMAVQDWRWGAEVLRPGPRPAGAIPVPGRTESAAVAWEIVTYSWGRRRESSWTSLGIRPVMAAECLQFCILGTGHRAQDTEPEGTVPSSWEGLV